MLEKSPIQFRIIETYCFGYTGGGRLEIDVSHTLAVEGYIMANSDNVPNTANDLSSGGSAGSILIRTVNFTGTHASCLVQEHTFRRLLLHSIVLPPFREIVLSCLCLGNVNDNTLYYSETSLIWTQLIQIIHLSGHMFRNQS